MAAFQKQRSASYATSGTYPLHPRTKNVPYVATNAESAFFSRTMSAPAAKKPRAGGPRFTLQLTFGSEGAMTAFKERMDALKAALAPAGASPLKPVELMAKLFDMADAHLTNQTPPPPIFSSAKPSAVSEHFLPSAGKIIHS
jgi:hypothetical protein